MKFRTEISVKPSQYKIDHKSPVMFIGSCFTDNMSRRLKALKFDVLTNPAGIIFNPASVADTVKSAVSGRTYGTDDLFNHNGIFHSFSHHSNFSSTDRNEAVTGMNRSSQEAHEFLKQCRYIFLTLGTAWIFRLRENGKIAANCHKLPQDFFLRELLTVPDTERILTETVSVLKGLNPEIRIVFTVSPVRHWKDGAVENQRSKSVLINAVHSVIDGSDSCSYFPAYEMMMDDLRDYRFYGDDLLHPSESAVNYIFEKFSECYFSNETADLNREIESITAMMNHRPFFPDSREYAGFKERLERKKEDLKKKAPYLNFDQA